MVHGNKFGGQLHSAGQFAQLEPHGIRSHAACRERWQQVGVGTASQMSRKRSEYCGKSSQAV